MSFTYDGNKLCSPYEPIKLHQTDPDTYCGTPTFKLVEGGKRNRKNKRKKTKKNKRKKTKKKQKKLMVNFF